MLLVVGSPWVGEGSIKQVREGRHKGKWRLQWTIAPGGAEQKVDRLFALKSEAVAWRDEKKVELKTGVVVAAVRSKKAATVQSVFEEFAGSKDEGFVDGKWVQDGASPLTVSTRAYRWGKWVEGTPIAKAPIAAINRDHARAHVRGMKARDAPAQTIADVVAVLKVLVNSAIAERRDCRDLVNPFLRLPLMGNEERALLDKARHEREAEEGPRLLTLAPKVAMAGLRRAQDPRLRALLGVHLLAGLRLGEGMALCREQLDFEREVIVIDRAVHLEPTGGQHVGLPKGNKIRLVAMTPTLARILRDHVERHDRDHLFSADRLDKPKMKAKTYRLWREALEAAALPPTLLPKGCRVSHNNWIEKLMAGKVSTSTRLEHMGHSLDRGDGQPSGVAVNLKNYTSHVPDAYAILRREIERVLAGKN